MPSFDKTLADAVAAHLSAITGSLPITGAVVAVDYLPIYDLADLEKPQIPVVPIEQIRNAKSRLHSTRDHEVQIAPHYRATQTAGKPDKQRVEDFLALCDALADELEKQATAAGATWLSSRQSPTLDFEQLKNGVLRAVLSVTYRRIASAA